MINIYSKERVNRLSTASLFDSYYKALSPLFWVYFIFLSMIVLQSLSGLFLPLDYMVDPNYSHALFAVALVDGSRYFNDLYPGLSHFPLYALVYKGIKFFADPQGFDVVASAIMAARIAQLLINLAIYSLYFLVLVKAVSTFSVKHSRSVVIWGSFIYAVQFPMIYYSFYLRPDNGIILGLLFCVLGLLGLRDKLGMPDFRVLGIGSALRAQLLVALGIVFMVISKNQSILLIGVVVAVNGYLIGSQTLSIKAVALHLFAVLGLYLGFSALIACVLMATTGYGYADYNWLAFFDPTYAARTKLHMASFAPEKFLRALGWEVALTAPAIFTVFILAVQRLIPWFAIVAVIAGIMAMTFVFFTRLFAVYNLVVPVLSVVIVSVLFLAKYVDALTEHIDSERKPALFALFAIAVAISLYANANLRSRTIDRHEIIFSERGNLDPVVYDDSKGEFVDAPDLSASLDRSPKAITYFRGFTGEINQLPWNHDAIIKIQGDSRFELFRKGIYFPFGSNPGNRTLREKLWFYSQMVGLQPLFFHQPKFAGPAEPLLKVNDMRSRIGLSEYEILIRFKYSRSAVPQTLISDWTRVRVGPSTYIAIKGDRLLRLGDGYDDVPSPFQFHEGEEYSITYCKKNNTVSAFLNGHPVFFIDGAGQRSFDFSKPIVVGNQGEYTGEPFLGQIISATITFGKQ